MSQQTIEAGATIYLDTPPNKPLTIPPDVVVSYDANQAIEWAPPYFKLIVIAVRKLLAPNFSLQTGATVYVGKEYMPRKNLKPKSDSDGLQDGFQRKMF